MFLRPLLCAFLCGSLVSLARGEDRFESFFSPRDAASVTADLEPGRGGSPDVSHLAARGTRVVARGGRNTWTVSGLAARTRLEHSVLLPPAGPVFPEHLSDVSGGVSVLNKTNERRLQGVSLSVGSASDELFHSLRETEISVTGAALRPSGATNAWIFLFNYSNNRSFLNNIPLPGVAYMWFRPQAGLRAVVGFPFVMVSYKSGPWTSSASLVATTNYSLRVARRLAGPLETYLAFERSPQQWLRAGREDRKKRLIYDENKVTWGVLSPLSRILTLDAGVGRTFTRRLFEADDATDSASKARLKDAWLFSLKLSATWGKPEKGGSPS